MLFELTRHSGRAGAESHCFVRAIKNQRLSRETAALDDSVERDQVGEGCSSMRLNTRSEIHIPTQSFRDHRNGCINYVASTGSCCMRSPPPVIAGKQVLCPNIFPGYIKVLELLPPPAQFHSYFFPHLLHKLRITYYQNGLPRDRRGLHDSRPQEVVCVSDRLLSSSMLTRPPQV